MAQVPYSPIPDVTASFPPTPEVHVNTPEAAFGGATAAALSKLGSTGNEVSNELYQRASAMQQLKNETDSRAASIDFATQADQRLAQFKTQFGENAGPEQYAQYQKDIADLRNKSRQGLNNPMSQKMYDADAAGVTINSLKYGAFHSAEQLKQYALTTNKQAIESVKSSTLAHPEDEAAYTDSLAKAKEHAETYGHLQGWGDDVIKQQVGIEQSAVTKNRITGLANNGDILGAKKVFDQANKDNALVGEDRASVQHFLNTQENTHGSRVVVDNTKDGTNFAAGSGVVDIERAKAGIKAVEGGDYSAIVSIKHTDAAQTPDRAVGAYQILESNLPQWLKDSGLPPMTAEEFAKNPAAQDKVFETKFGQDMQKNGSFNAAADNWLGKGKADASGTTHSAYLGKANAALYKSSSLPQRVAMTRQSAGDIAPENKEFPDYVENHTIADFNHEKQEEKGVEDYNNNIITSAIQQQQGKGPMTVDNLKKTSPEFAAVYEKMPEAKQLALTTQLTRLSKQDNDTTPQREQNFNKLQGQAFIDPEGFKGAKLTDVDLTGDQRTSLAKLQQQTISKNIVMDPALTGAIRDPGVIATANSIGAGPGNKEEWHTFTGALAEDIKFARAQGKPVTTNDVQDMATKLVQQRAGSGWFFDSLGVDREYRIPLHGIPPAVQEKERAFLREKLKSSGTEREPTDQEVERLHALSLYVATQKSKSNAGQ